jgi:putative CocE/NonD family hydrolase
VPSDGAPARDQRPLELRKDVLVYTSAPLAEPLTIVGLVEVVLYVSSTAKDTDFMVKLTDVHPDGRSVCLDGDAFRVRYRHGFDREALLEPGEIAELTLTNMATAIRLPAGHRIRLDVASSSFPYFERNLNTGGRNFDESTWLVATNTVHHGPEHPSHVLLPVLGR